MINSISQLLGKSLSSRFYDNPIFQVGASRSGTIVLYKSLGTHPKIFSMPSEDPFISHVASGVTPFEFGDETDYFEESVALSKPYLYKQLKRLCFESAAGPNFGWKNQVKGIMNQKSSFFTKTMWCVKTFPLEQHAHSLLKLYPNARFIYIVRNGIDVVQPRTKFPAFRDLSFEFHCQFWVQAAKKFAYLNHLPEAVQVRQEELQSDPDDMFRRITAHLGIEHHVNPVNFVKTTLVHSMGDKQTHENVDVKKSIIEREPGYATWDEQEREIFKKICGASMEAHGYAIPF